MNNGFGTIAFGTVMGGAGSRLGGGNFWQGAVTGLIVSMMNHVMHQSAFREIDPPNKYKRYFRMMSRLLDNIKTIDSNSEAVYHYYYGDFEPVQLGPNTIKSLINSNEYQRVSNRLVTGVAESLNDDFSVNLTFQGAFFVGSTNVNYSTTCDKVNCTTNFRAFVNDGFRDPLDIGKEVPSPVFYSVMGTYAGLPKPYVFIPYSFSIKYSNPGYSITK
ncbi:hypothetical protein OX284_006150 [Flavobacterium sp. SUN046]|uniref:hypothetical protein n=1 Tax=Flavobacterium sp. SUN046 TaxID=3002440 RepID=UPI002DBCBBD4|nr:hypothetical protein [Flavobacterium sp. SUN046]MEC4049002.1 hypothetical protein [Flavobacterium sp. SUN046]